jgi:hypothetical protein
MFALLAGSGQREFAYPLWLVATMCFHNSLPAK